MRMVVYMTYSYCYAASTVHNNERLQADDVQKKEKREVEKKKQKSLKKKIMWWHYDYVDLTIPTLRLGLHSIITCKVSD